MILRYGSARSVRTIFTISRSRLGLTGKSIFRDCEKAGFEGSSGVSTFHGMFRLQTFLLLVFLADVYCDLALRSRTIILTKSTERLCTTHCSRSIWYMLLIWHFPHCFEGLQARTTSGAISRNQRLSRVFSERKVCTRSATAQAF